MPPAESIGLWSRVLKLMFTAARIAKSRAPSAPRITFIIDEAAQLGKFKALSDLYTIGAGIGIRPLAVYQGTKQMDVTIENGQSIMTGSAGCRSYFAIRDIESASALSTMLGSQTLEYDDPMQTERARHAKAQMLEAVVAGHDPMSSGLNYAHHRRTSEIKLKQQRMLRTPDEVMNMPGDKQYIFADGLPHPIYADRKPYYNISFMKGRYYPNPYHPDARGLRVKGLVGHRFLRVIRERVPREFAHYPQYQDGTWMRLSD